MASKWKELVRITFRGDRFDGHALDLNALNELTQFQCMITETAKALWRQENPGRERLPKNFEQRTRLCLRTIEEGSAVAPLEVYLDEPEQRELFELEAPAELADAVGLAFDVFSAIDRGIELPDRFPRALLSEFAKWGQTLCENESMDLQPIGCDAIGICSKHREHFAALSEQPYEDVVEVTGEVIEADVRQLRFQVWTKEGRNVPVLFDVSQEEMVTTALKEHRKVRITVRGRGRFTADGVIVRCEKIDHLRIHPVNEEQFDSRARSIEDELWEIASQVPEEEWERVPADLTDNLDHYLYGTPKE
jgi:hypothetical protein